jgi:hypothetical protein
VSSTMNTAAAARTIAVRLITFHLLSLTRGWQEATNLSRDLALPLYSPSFLESLSEN